VRLKLSEDSKWSALRDASAVVLLLERGYSDEFAMDNVGHEIWGPRLERWLDSDADFGAIIAIRPRSDDELARFRSALARNRQSFIEAVRQSVDYLKDMLEPGAKIAWLQGSAIAAETQERLREVLSVSPSPWVH
jgi:hypothetical protein